MLRLRFGVGESTDYTLEEVGQRFAVTRERIRQIEAKALRKLRRPQRARALGERAPRAASNEVNLRAHSSVWSEPPAHNR